jgi:peptide deformylase
VPIDIDKLAVIHYPDPRLRKKAEPVAIFDDELAQVAERMKQLMKLEKGVGLAAPQVGLGMRMFVMNPSGEADGAKVIVNPQLSQFEGSAEDEEGCLSIPEVRVQIRRPAQCVLRARTITGETYETPLSDFEARIVQHETDHLNGVLILDKMGPADRIKVKRTIRALEEAFERRKRGR